MRPGGVFGDEFLQEEGGGDGSGVASRILEVGELVLERIGVFFFEGHAPELFTAGFTAVDDLQGEIVVVAEESGDGVAEGADHGAREGGEVHDMGGSDFSRFGKSVAKHQTAFGVGIVDHDGLAVLGLEDVARQYGLVADGVFGEAADGADADGKLEGRDSLDGGERGGGTAHVADHFGHGLGRLEAEAAGIEGEALADDGQMVLGGVLGRLVVEGDHERRAGAALADGHVAHKAFFFKLLHVADLDGKARRILDDGLGAFDEFGGVEVGGAGVDEVLRERDRLLFYGDFFGDFLEGGAMFAGDNLVGHREVFFLLALVGVELVVGVVEPVEDRLELFVDGIGEEEAHAADLFFHGAAREAVCGHAQVVEVRKPAFLGGIYEQSGITVDFEKFEIFKRAVLDAFEDCFDLGAARIGQNLGKLHRLLDKKQGVGLVGGFARFTRDNFQLHAYNVAKNGSRDLFVCIRQRRLDSRRACATQTAAECFCGEIPRTGGYMMALALGIVALCGETREARLDEP